MSVGIEMVTRVLQEIKTRSWSAYPGTERLQDTEHIMTLQGICWPTGTLIHPWRPLPYASFLYHTKVVISREILLKAIAQT